MEHRKIIAGSASTGLLLVAQALIGMFTATLLARLMGPSGFGIYSFGLAVATLFTIPMKNGVSGLIVREVSRALVAEDWATLKGVMRWAWGVTLLYCVIIGGLVALAGLLFAPDDPMARATVLSMLLVPLWSLVGTWSGGVRGLGRPVAALLPDSVLRPTIHLALASGAVLLLGLHLTPDLAMALHIAAAGIAAFWLMAVFRHHMPKQCVAARSIRCNEKNWMRAALPFAALGGLQIANRQADLIILGFLTDESQVGLYRVAIQGSMLVTFGSQAVNIVVSPYFAQYCEGHDRAMIWSIMRLSVFFSLMIALPVVAIFATYGRELVSLVFGTAFAGAALPLALLSAANALAMLNGSVMTLMNMTGCERDTVRVFCVAIMINVILNLIFVQMFGTLGAATAAFSSTCVWNLLLRQAARRRLGIDPIATVFQRGPKA